MIADESINNSDHDENTVPKGFREAVVELGRTSDKYRRVLDDADFDGPEKTKLTKLKADIDRITGDIRGLFDNQLERPKSADLMDEAIDKTYHEEKKGAAYVAIDARILPHFGGEIKEKYEERLIKWLSGLTPKSMTEYEEYDPDFTRDMASSLVILSKSGYIDLVAIWVKFFPMGNPEDAEKIMREWHLYKEIIKQEQKLDPSKYENRFNHEKLSPKAKEYLEAVREKDPEVVRMAKNIHYLLRLVSTFGRQYHTETGNKLDCNDTSVMTTTLCQEMYGYSPEYISTNDHVAIRIKNTPLIIDPFDNKIRHVDEFLEMDRRDYLISKKIGIIKTGGKLESNPYVTMDEMSPLRHLLQDVRLESNTTRDQKSHDLLFNFITHISSGQKRVEETIEKADNLIQTDKISQAIDMLKEILQRYPKNNSIRKKLSSAYFYRSYALIEETRKLGKEDPNFINKWEEVLSSLKEGIVITLNQAITENIENTLTVTVNNYIAATGNLENVNRIFIEIVEAHPNNKYFRKNLAIIYSNIAVGLVREAKELDDTNPNLIKKYEEAIDNYIKMTTSLENNERIKQRFIEDAKNALLTVLEVHPRNESLILSYSKFLDSNSDPEAEEWKQKAQALQSEKK